MSEIRSADLFEDRGWQDAYYPGTKLFVWRNPAFPGLMIDVAFDSDDFVVFAGDPLRKGKFGRLTAFDDAAVAIAFCERAASLADWPQAGEWTAPPAGVDEQLHQIALEVTRGGKPRGQTTTVPTPDGAARRPAPAEAEVTAFLELFHWKVDPSVDPIRTRIHEFFIDYLNSKGSEGGTTEEGQVVFDAAVAHDPASWPLPADRLHALWRDTTNVLNKLPKLSRPAQLVWLGWEASHDDEIIKAALYHEFPLFTPADVVRVYRETADYLQHDLLGTVISNAIFQAWADIERAKGRPEEELLMGECIDALGIGEKTASGGTYLNFNKLKDIADPELRHAVIAAGWKAQEEQQQRDAARRR